MMGLSKTMPVYACNECGWSGGRLNEDEYTQFCPICDSEHSGKPHHERDARYWSVAVYVVDRRYGGPEEGGWYYDAGYLTDFGRARIFDNIGEARNYMQSLLSAYKNIRDHTIRGMTEEMPVTHYPKHRPRYS